MAGTITGLVDARVGDGASQSAALNNQEAFTVIYNYLNSKYTRVSSNFGSSGTGFDFHDGTNPSGENAWAVFTADSASVPFDILIQWADVNSFGSSPGNPGLLQGSIVDGVGIMAAFREDGTSPWGGTTDDDGADTKGSTVWTPGTSTLHVLGRSNTTGGSHATNKENTFSLCDVATVGGFGRIHCVGDDDGLVIMTDHDDDGDYQGLYLGAYAPRTGLSINFPLCLIVNPDTTPVFWATGANNTFGSTTGNQQMEGGMVGRDESSGVRGLSVNTNIGAFETAFQPNNQLASPELDASEIAILHRETQQGLSGFVPSALMAAVFNVNNHEVNAGGTRAYLAETTVAALKWSIAWGGGNPPGTNTNRSGVSF